LTPLAGFSPWVLLGGIAVAVLLAIAPLYRFWQWQQGAGLRCLNCGGPLGDLVDGRYGPYYKCLRCGTNIAAGRVH
jgi:DNA-directed RNA polymerase subunit RPC12/RpoP